MRSCEEDFNFNFEEGIRCRRLKGFRIDECYSLNFGSLEERLFDYERQARINACMERVETERHTRALPLSSLK